MKHLNAFDLVAFTVLIIGGINWGVISIFSTDLVSYVFGTMTVVTRSIYGIVGLAAIYMVYIVSLKLD